MHSLWHTVVLALVADVWTIATIHNLELCIFLEGLHMTLFLLVKNLLRLKNDEVVESKVLEQAKTIAPYCLMIIAYIWLLNKLGYIISTVIFMIASLIFLKLKNKVLMIVLSVVVTLVLYYIFTNFLVVVLPKGRWFNIAF